MDRSSGPPLRFLALGDSYTAGEGVDPKDSWPVQFVDLLRGAERDVSEPVIIAKTGWTTDELLAAVAVTDLAQSFELVSLLIGVNNLYRGRTPENYRVEFRTLLNLAVRFAGGRNRNVVVLSIPDWGATPFAEGKDRARIARDTDLFNALNRTEAAAQEVHYVDITGESRNGLQHPSLLTTDGLHPSGEMYAAWARLVAREMFPELR
jgi:lysophospholipase L1-like esterase